MPEGFTDLEMSIFSKFCEINQTGSQQNRVICPFKAAAEVGIDLIKIHKVTILILDIFKKQTPSQIYLSSNNPNQ